MGRPRRRLDLTVRGDGVTTSMRLWWAEAEDWRRLLGQAGFEDIEAFGWFDRRRLGPGSADSVWIARTAPAS